jgi:hypothetical protein
MLLAPLFLVGLLAIGLPLWLHRFARDTRTKEPFASLMLLEASQIHRSREHTLRYWLLLALRIALLLLLVLAFTEPMLPWRTPPLQARDRTLHVIVLDTSLSMQQGGRWERAVAQARKLIDALRPADQGMLVTADSRVRVVRGPVNESAADELRTALTAVKPGFGRLDYGMLMTSASSWIGTQRPPTQLHLVTDLQQSATPLQFADLEPPAGVKLLIADVGGPAATNRYVRAVAPSAQDSDALEVRVSGKAAPGEQRSVVLSIDGKVAGRKTIGPAPAADEPAAQEGGRLSDANTPGKSGEATGGGAGDAANDAGGAGDEDAVDDTALAVAESWMDTAGSANPPNPRGTRGAASAAIAARAAGDARVIFPGLELGKGAHRVTVSLDPADSLPQDDQFYAVLEHREPRALIIGANSSADDVSYFAAAVGALTNPRLAVERVGADAIGQRALADYSTLVVSDVGVLSAASVGAIQRYLEGGGAVLMTLGARAAQLTSIPLGGQQRTERVVNARDGGIRVAAVEQSHPALRDAQGWRSVRFFRYVPVDARADDTVLIRFEDGHPLLLERRIGAGRLLVLTSPLDRDWNDLAIHPLFVRFIGEAARYLTASAAAPNTTAGSMLPIGVNGHNGAQVFDPRGRRVLALGDRAAERRLVADQVGFYEVRGGGRSDWIAVNGDARESDLERMSTASVEQWHNLQPASRQAGAQSSATAQATENAGPTRQLKAIWPWLLLIAVTLAFIEPLVANSHLHVRRGVTS